jgi:hypothetical protein
VIVTLSPKDELIVQFNGTDGEFSIHFDTDEFPNAIVVEETGGYPDSTGRQDILYKEDFD